MSITRFRYKSVMDSEDQMYEDVKKALTPVGLSARRFHSIMVAISEAFTNALIHGNNLISDKMIELTIEVNGKRIIADIKDEGGGIATDASNHETPDPLSEGGRGMGLMRMIADEVRFGRNNVTGGATVSLRFNRDRNINEDNKEENLEGKMDIQRKDAGNVIVISLSGRMDLGNGNRLKDEVKAILATGKTSVHLNLKNVEFVNSSGLGALVSIMKEVRIHRGRLTLSDMADYVREIFDITQLSHIFEIFPSEEEALHSYQGVPCN